MGFGETRRDTCAPSGRLSQTDPFKAHRTNPPPPTFASPIILPPDSSPLPSYSLSPTELSNFDWVKQFRGIKSTDSSNNVKHMRYEEAKSYFQF